MPDRLRTRLVFKPDRGHTTAGFCEPAGSRRHERVQIPTILEILGWRLFFYANEGNEPIHVHARKAESECKYWIDIDNYDIVEAYAFNLGPPDRRQIRRIIFDHFDYIVDRWNEFQRRKMDG